MEVFFFLEFLVGGVEVGHFGNFGYELVGLDEKGGDIGLDEMIYEVTIDFPHVMFHGEVFLLVFGWEDEFSEGVICLLLGGTVRKECHTVIEV